MVFSPFKGFHATKTETKRPKSSQSFHNDGMLEAVASVGCILAVLPADKVVAEYLLLTVILVSADQIQRAEGDPSASPAESAFSLCISCKCACDRCNILLKRRVQLRFLVRTCQAEL